MKKRSFKRSLVLLTLVVVPFLLSSCDFDDVSNSEGDPPPSVEPVEVIPVDTAGSVAADGVLETVTWNLEWFGTGRQNPDNFGPDDELLQAANVITVLDSLEADLYAFQEINSPEWIDSLTTYMPGYAGMTAPFAGNQRTAFIYNEQSISVTASGLIRDGQNDNDWAGGRLPFFLAFDYSFNGTTVPFYAIVIHAKASADQQSYQRRVRAAQSLYTYLNRNHPTDNIILLGDYNDDVDVSIYDESESPYTPFVNDSQAYTVITQMLSEQGISSTIGFDDMIDHITFSNDAAPFYVPNSVRRVDPRMDNFIQNYGTTTSDHFPIMAAFSIVQ